MAQKVQSQGMGRVVWPGLVPGNPDGALASFPKQGCLTLLALGNGVAGVLGGLPLPRGLPVD